jgi:hypothetical protein
LRWTLWSYFGGCTCTGTIVALAILALGINRKALSADLRSLQVPLRLLVRRSDLQINLCTAITIYNQALNSFKDASSLGEEGTEEGDA